MIHTIDAQNLKLGKVASRAAAILIGKNLPSFRRNKFPAVTVKVINTSKADLPEKKRVQKTYVSYSGYPGGIKRLSMATVIEKKGYGELFRSAVYGMLPKNKLRARMIKNLIITE